MKTTKRIEETRTYGDPDRDDTGISLMVDYGEGNKPTSVHFRIDDVGATRTIEEMLRIAQAILDAGWVPEGHYVCADHGFYDARSSDSARCSRCEVAA